MKKSMFLVFAFLLVTSLLTITLLFSVSAQDIALDSDQVIVLNDSNDLSINQPEDLNETDVNESEIEQAEQELEQEKVVLPNQKGYKWSRFKERLKLVFTWSKKSRIEYKLKLAQRRAAMLSEMAKQNITEKYEIIARQYNKTLEDIENKLEKLEAKGKNVTLLREHLQNMTYKHVLVLQRVLAKAPLAAKAGLNNAILASQNQWLKLQIRFLRKQDVNETLIQELINKTRELRQIRKEIKKELAERKREQKEEQKRNETQEQEENETCIDINTNLSMTLKEAKQIASASVCSGNCTAGKCLKGPKICNSNTGTWWLDLNIKKQGCVPACVVNIANKTAEINWRCTGLVE